MFLDTDSWPPAPDGSEPAPKRPPRLDAAQERFLMRAIGLFLLGSFLAPLAGSSVIVALVALARAAIAGAGLR